MREMWYGCQVFLISNPSNKYNHIYAKPISNTSIALRLLLHPKLYINTTQLNNAQHIQNNTPNLPS